MQGSNEFTYPDISRAQAERNSIAYLNDYLQQPGVIALCYEQEFWWELLYVINAMGLDTMLNISINLQFADGEALHFTSFRNFKYVQSTGAGELDTLKENSMDREQLSIKLASLSENKGLASVYITSRQ